ncbi:MAG TPA: hypothetical protein VNR11_05600 [Xanthobacteraceae bacterium]|nr:hypothetical protein [Xanthobacteraceae bacterium]
MDTTAGIRSDWCLNIPFWRYFGIVIVLALVVRIALSALRAPKLAYEAKGSFRTYFVMFFRTFSGFHPKLPGSDPKGEGLPPDYWYPFFLGVLELTAYPILIAINAQTGIGAWIALKALAQWKVWAEDRAVFNLFLIGNAMNVLLAFLVLKQFVS